LVGDPLRTQVGRKNPKNKTFLRNETHGQFEDSARLPLVGPGLSKHHQKGDPTPDHLLADFQAHLSMRICWRAAELRPARERIGRRYTQLNLTVLLYKCYGLFMPKGSGASETVRLSALAGELRVSIGKLNRRLREQAHPGDFTSAQKSVILRLESDGPATVSMLARAESVRPQSMRVTVASLQAAGLVGGESDPTDGRQTIFRLTRACRDTLRTTRAAREDWLFRALQAQLTTRERERLAAAVEFLKRLAGF
jgi:DNA-binding MarR family transcriptional regulator